MIVGGLSGFFVVPMNALLQHRGHVLLSAGHSIAVQNFNENLSVLVMLCLYAVLVWLDVPVAAVIVLFGTFVCVMMWLVMRRHRANQRAFDSGRADRRSQALNHARGPVVGPPTVNRPRGFTLLCQSALP